MNTITIQSKNGFSINFTSLFLQFLHFILFGESSTYIPSISCKFTSAFYTFYFQKLVDFTFNIVISLGVVYLLLSLALYSSLFIESSSKCSIRIASKSINNIY